MAAAAGTGAVDMSSPEKGAAGGGSGGSTASHFMRISSSSTHAVLSRPSASRLFRLLDLAAANVDRPARPRPASTDDDEADLDDAAAGTGAAFPCGASAVSEWNLFAAFVAQAVEQVERLFDALFTADDADIGAGGDAGAGTAGSAALQALLADPDVGAGCASLVLQAAHATGVLLGLACRFGVACRCQLPRAFRQVLGMAAGPGLPASIAASSPAPAPTGGGTAASLPVAHLFTMASAWALRHGLTSVYPEAAWNLLRPSAVAALTDSGGAACFCPELLRLEALYDGGVYPEDPHVQLFWIALAELPPAQVLQLLRKVWAHAALPEEAYYVPRCPSPSDGRGGGGSVLPAPLRILQPTAVAMLSPDAADITVFPEKHALSIPRFSTLAIVRGKILELMKNK
jgi:hypothetical protein